MTPEGIQQRLVRKLVGRVLLPCFCIIATTAVLEFQLAWNSSVGYLYQLQDQRETSTVSSSLDPTTISPSASYDETKPSLPKNQTNLLHLDFFDSLFSSSSERKRLESNFSHFFDARDAHGRLGYIADPTSLRRGVKAFLTQRRKNQGQLDRVASSYFDVLQHYERKYRNGTKTADMRLDQNATCCLPGGQGLENTEGGFKLLSQKLEIAPRPANDPNNPRLLCMLYTYDKNRDMARASALTWGVKCDGFLAFSTETIPSLGMLDLVHPGKEEYINMWQKIRSIWGYVGKHYLHDYDYFHIGGDDLYLIVENLRELIATRLEKDRDKPVITAAHARVWPEIDNFDHIIGGPGYTMNRVALQKFVDVGLKKSGGCSPTVVSAVEDQLMARCFIDRLKVNLTDSHDPITGEQLYHHNGADRVYGDSANGTKYIHRARKYWSSLPHPTRTNETIGRKEGMDAAYKHSVAFHFFKSPSHFLRYTAILYRLCPSSTPLGESLRQVDQSKVHASR